MTTSKVILAPSWIEAKLAFIQHQKVNVLNAIPDKESWATEFKPFLLEVESKENEIDVRRDLLQSNTEFLQQPHISLSQRSETESKIAFLTEKLDILLDELYAIAPKKGVYTVEAEYGQHVLEGEYTLAHHVDKYKHLPAPCNQEITEPVPGGSIIIISHIDLDTIGGILALQGKKPKDEKFWSAAENVDVKGYHHINDVEFSDQKSKLDAFNAWNHENGFDRRQNQTTNVTKQIKIYADILERVTSCDPELISKGKEWAEGLSNAVEQCLVLENDYVRIFETDSVFCNASYFSPSKDKIIPTTISYNTKYGSITIAAAEPGYINARDIVQKAWGPEAGGHAGIAGSPRNMVMSKPIDSDTLDYKNVPMDQSRLQRLIAGVVEPETDFEDIVVSVMKEVEPKRDLIDSLNTGSYSTHAIEYGR